MPTGWWSRGWRRPHPPGPEGYFGLAGEAFRRRFLFFFAASGEA